MTTLTHQSYAPGDGAIAPRALRDACASFATGVTIVSTTTKDGDHGMTANAFMSVSLDPPLISISLDRSSRMLAKVRESQRYAVSVLSSEMETLAMHFAGRFDPTLSNPCEHAMGLPVVPDASAVFIADVTQDIEAGDHAILIGQVRHITRSESAMPLLFHAGKFASLG